jgi:hypothetical protein
MAREPGRSVLLASFAKNRCEVWATLDRTETVVERINWTGHLKVRAKSPGATRTGQKPDGDADMLLLDPPVRMDEFGLEVAWL